jgi:hypothetical protein
MHAYNQMKMVGHDAESKNVNEIESAQRLNLSQQIVLFSGFKRESGQSRPRNNMVHRRHIGANKSGYAGHGSNLQRVGNKHKKSEMR